MSPCLLRTPPPCRLWKTLFCSPPPREPLGHSPPPAEGLSLSSSVLRGAAPSRLAPASLATPAHSCTSLAPLAQPPSADRLWSSSWTCVLLCLPSLWRLTPPTPGLFSPDCLVHFQLCLEACLCFHSPASLPPHPLLLSASPVVGVNGSTQPPWSGHLPPAPPTGRACWFSRIFQRPPFSSFLPSPQPALPPSVPRAAARRPDSFPCTCLCSCLCSPRASSSSAGACSPFQALPPAISVSQVGPSRVCVAGGNTEAQNRSPVCPRCRAGRKPRQLGSGARALGPRAVPLLRKSIPSPLGFSLHKPSPPRWPERAP